MKNMMEKADRLYEVTQQVGYALWQLQELEGCAAIYFVLSGQATRGMGRVAGDVLIDKAQSRTFGETIKQLAKAGLLPSELAARFAKLLDERNWLVHRSRADSRGAIHGDGAAPQLLQRLNTIAEEAAALLQTIGALVERFARENGVSQQYIDEESRRLLKQWQNGDDV